MVSLEYRADLPTCISNPQAGGMLYRHLHHDQKKHKKRYGKLDVQGQIKAPITIDQYPAGAEKESRIGDGEINLLNGVAVVLDRAG